MTIKRSVVYTHLLYLIAILSIVPAIVAFDRTLGWQLKDNVSPQAKVAAERIFNAIFNPPESFLRVFGFYAGGHNVQMWPPGWPYVSAFTLRSFLICFPFWSVLAVIFVELSFLCAKIARRVRVRGSAREPFT